MLRRNKKSDKTRMSGQKPRSMSTQQYYQATPSNPQNNDKKPKKPWLLYLTIGCLLIAFLYSATLNSNPNLTVNSEVYRPKSEYQKVIGQALSSPLNKNKLTLNTKAIEEQVRATFAEVSNISFNVPLFGQKADVDVRVVQPAILLSSGTDKYVIDKQGRAVVKNPTSDTTKLVKLNDQSGFEIKLGEQVLTTEEVSFISYLNEQANKHSLKVKEFVLPSQTPAELYMYLEDKPYFVKFFLGGSADIQLGSYLALINQLSANGQVPSQYVDVRVEERVFVK